MRNYQLSWWYGIFHGWHLALGPHDFVQALLPRPHPPYPLVLSLVVNMSVANEVSFFATTSVFDVAVCKVSFFYQWNIFWGFSKPGPQQWQPQPNSDYLRIWLNHQQFLLISTEKNRSMLRENSPHQATMFSGYTINKIWFKKEDRTKKMQVHEAQQIGPYVGVKRINIWYIHNIIYIYFNIYIYPEYFIYIYMYMISSSHPSSSTSAARKSSVGCVRDRSEGGVATSRRRQGWRAMGIQRKPAGLLQKAMANHHF